MVLASEIRLEESIGRSLKCSTVDQEGIRTPHAGSGEYCATDLFVDFGAIYISRACLHRMLLHLFFFSLLFYLSFPLRIDPLRFQAGGHERRPNQGFFSVLVYFML